MLHEEVLALLHYFVILSRGRVLEIGSYVGGSTVMMASAAKQYSKPPIIAVEPGGRDENHPDIPSLDIIADLEANIRSFDVTNHVQLLNGSSNQSEVQRAVKTIIGHGEIDLFFIDADGYVGRDIEQYSSLLRDRAVLVLDDYSSALAPHKERLVSEWVDHAVSEGRVISLGIWGWGTWIGLYVKHPSSPDSP